jgi:hypothetical protein
MEWRRRGGCEQMENTGRRAEDGIGPVSYQRRKDARTLKKGHIIRTYVARQIAPGCERRAEPTDCSRAYQVFIRSSRMEHQTSDRGTRGSEIETQRMQCVIAEQNRNQASNHHPSKIRLMTLISFFLFIVQK